MNTGSIMARNTNNDEDAQVTQLEFHQAMNDFKTMFPNTDEEVIEYVLRCNDGAVDATIDQLLVMVSDSEKVKGKPANTVGSKSQLTMRTETNTANNVASIDDLFFDIESSSSSLPPYSARSTGQERLTTGEGQSRPTQPQLISFSDEPDGLSFLDPPSYLSTSNSNAISSSAGDTRSNPDATPFSQASGVRNFNLLASNDTAVTTVSKNSTALDRRFSKTIPVQDTTGILSQKFSNTSLRARFRWEPPILGQLPESFLRVPQSSHHRNRSQAPSQRFDASLQSRNRETTASTSPSSTNFISSAMLAKKMQENERRRQQAIVDDDEEVARYLEDERFAILLQNAEFVHELRHNQEFMSQLEMDNRYGGNVPFNAPSSGSAASSGGPSSIAISDAAFREALKNMGKKSKKKFAQLAGVFKKKKGNLFNEGNFGHGFTGIAEVTSSPHRQSRDFLLDDSYREFENEYSSDSERDRNSPYWERDANRPPHTQTNSSSRLYTSSKLHPTQQNHRH